MFRRRASSGRAIKLQTAFATNPVFDTAIRDLLMNRLGKLYSVNGIALLQAAVRAFGQEDTSLWLRYAKFLEKNGKGAGHIVWRGTKELHDAQSLLSAINNKESRKTGQLAMTL